MNMLKRGLTSLLVLTMALSLFAGIPVVQAEAAANVLYVATNGDDNAAGTFDAPLATLEGARDKIRGMASAEKAGGVTVFLRGGVYYRLGDSFRLEEQDSGTAAAPITYAAYPGETVELRGSLTVDGTSFTAVTDEAILGRLPDAVEGEVKVLDLGAMGYTDFAPLEQTGKGWDDKAPTMSVAVNGVKQTLSRYPNNSFLPISSVQNHGFEPRNHWTLLADGYCVEGCYDICKYPKSEWTKQTPPSWTTYNTELAAKAELWLQEEEIWTQGYFRYTWADDNLKVNVTAVSGGMKFDAAFPAFYGVYSGDFFAYNLLCELDMPGEFYLDRQNAKLYLYPSSDLTDGTVDLALMGKSFIVADGVDYVNFENIDFKHSNSHGVELLDCSNCLIAGCDFNNLGQRAVMIGENCNQADYAQQNTGSRGGSNNKVLSCNISDMGQGGIFLGGGNRYTLTAGNNVVENCDFENFSVTKRTDAPAVEIIGCGNKVLRNRMHNAPDNVILYLGNDHLIQGNEIFDVLYETADVGAIYAGRSWTYQGNQIHNNYLHDLAVGNASGTAAFYLDDIVSGTSITNNLLVNIPGYALFWGGGRDNTYQNNIQINYGNGNSMSIDSRALDDWGATMAHKPGGEMYVELMNLIQNSQFDWNVWAQKYPKLMELVNPQTKDMNGLVEKQIRINGSGELVTVELPWQYLYPSNAVITNNIMVGVNGESITGYITDSNHQQTYNNVYDGSSKYAAGTDVGFEDVAAQNFTVKEDSIIKQVQGDDHFDVSVVGLYSDTYRTVGSGTLAGPELVEPANGAENAPFLFGGTSVSVKWNKVAQAGHYKVELAKDESFAEIVQTKNSSEPYVVLTALEKNTTYYWRVTAVEKGLNGGSGISEVHSFTTGSEMTTFIRESFEQGFDIWTNIEGNADVSTSNAKDGEKSYLVNQEQDNISIELEEALPTSMSVWMYDSGTTGIEVVGGFETAGNQKVFLGASKMSNSNYFYRADPRDTSGNNYIYANEQVSSVARSTGWHKLSFIYVDGGYDLYIDYEKVARVDTAAGIKKIWLGDLWTGDTVCNFLFDDLYVGEQEAPQAPASNEFRESFENGFGAWTETFGTPTASDSAAKDGSYSYLIDEVTDCANKVFDNPLETSMSVWMYDSGVSGIEVIAGFETEEGQKVFLGAGSSKSDTHYFYRTDLSSNWQDAIEAVSTVERTAGWHKLSFISNGDGTYDLYIDTEKVATAQNITGIKKVWLGDLWGEDNICSFMFDDLYVGEQKAPQAPAPNEFRESFENGFGAWTETFGTPTASDSAAKDGSYSYLIDEVTDCANKVFDNPLETSMSVWMYDSGVSGIEVIGGFETAEGQKVFLGAGSSKSDTHYFYRADLSSNWQDAIEAVSTVERTAGWHKLSFISNGDGTYDLYIDTEKVATAQNITGIKKVWLGDLWGEDNICSFMFDDLYVGEQEAPEMTDDEKAAVAVDKLIDEIGEFTLESKAAIDAARAAYDALTDDQKAMVKGLSDLEAAEAKYKELADAAAKEEVDQAAADAVIEKIEALTNVTLESKSSIEAARAAYDALTAEQKARVPAEIVDTLEAAEEELAKLEKEAEDKNDGTHKPGIITPSKPVVSQPAQTAKFPFVDVAENAWYYDEVKEAWENNLINGMSEDKFDPNGKLTVAQAIKLAAALHQMEKNGKVTLKNGDETWYTTYVDYAIANGIIDKAYADLTYAQMNAAVTRKEFVGIFYGAKEFYAKKNVVADNSIPDVKLGDAYADEIYAFYRAGILTGNDNTGAFAPNSSIKRCEVAAILIRMYDISARHQITLK